MKACKVGFTTSKSVKSNGNNDQVDEVEKSRFSEVDWTTVVGVSLKRKLMKSPEVGFATSKSVYCVM
jgi:hypothetical protein